MIQSKSIDLSIFTKNRNVLHLTLKKKWFNMVGRGFKKEEYREIKEYWTKRLTDTNTDKSIEKFKKFNTVVFKNGYARDAPTLILECKGIKTDFGNPNWGANDKIYYCIILGNILYDSTKCHSQSID